MIADGIRTTLFASAASGMVVLSQVDAAGLMDSARKLGVTGVLAVVCVYLYQDGRRSSGVHHAKQEEAQKLIVGLVQTTTNALARVAVLLDRVTKQLDKME